MKTSLFSAACLFAGAACANAADGALSKLEVMKLISGNSLSQGEMTFAFKPDGTFDAGNGRTGSGGQYTVQPDGRLCWKNSHGFAGCFQYYRKGPELRVRRNDAQSKADIAKVTVSPLR